MKTLHTYYHRRSLVLLLLATFLFVNCSQGMEDKDEDTIYPIKLSASMINATTRSVNDSQNSMFGVNTYVTIYPYKGTGTVLTDPVYGSAFPATGIDYHTSAPDENSKNELLSTIPDPSYPNENSGQVTIVGIHPVIGSETFAGSPPSYTFTVKQDQSTAASYKLCDLMTAKTKSNRSESAIDLHFYHRLAKVTITFTSVSGTPNICKVELLTMKPSVTVNVQTSVVGTTASGNDTDIICYNNIDGTNVETSVSALIPAQSAKVAATPFIRFTFFGGGSIVWDLTDAVTLTAGHHYQYNLSVGLKAVGVLNTTVTDWTADGSSETGTDHTVEV